MAQMHLQQVNTDAWRTALQRDLLDLVSDDYVLESINYILVNEMRPYVPYKTGRLVGSVQVGPREIRYATPYARYQYYGEVYGPNYWVPITRGANGGWDKSGEWGWRSPKRKPKYPTGRALTYHTPGTTSFWYEEMMLQRRQSVNLQITSLLKRHARSRGL